jgi:hypothetical protein
MISEDPLHVEDLQSHFCRNDTTSNFEAQGLCGALHNVAELQLVNYLPVAFESELFSDLL